MSHTASDVATRTKPQDALEMSLSENQLQGLASPLRKRSRTHSRTFEEEHRERAQSCESLEDGSKFAQEELRQRLGARLHKVTGGGNCGFDCVRDGLCPDMTVEDLRTTANCPEPQWADEGHLETLCKHLSASIKIYQVVVTRPSTWNLDQEALQRTIGQDTADRTIEMIHYSCVSYDGKGRGHHYDLLVTPENASRPCPQKVPQVRSSEVTPEAAKKKAAQEEAARQEAAKKAAADEEEQMQLAIAESAAQDEERQTQLAIAESMKAQEEAAGVDDADVSLDDLALRIASRGDDTRGFLARQTDWVYEIGDSVRNLVTLNL